LARQPKAHGQILSAWTVTVLACASCTSPTRTSAPSATSSGPRPAGVGPTITSRRCARASARPCAGRWISWSSGDLFDRSRPPRRIIVEAAALLAEVARQTPMLLVNGNHDWRGYRRAFPVPPPGLEVIDHPSRRIVGGVALALVPWAPT